MAQNQSYSFKDVNAAIVGPGGAFSLTGSAAEEGITIEMRADKNDLQVGADGNWMHSLRADKSGTITISLLKNSPINAQLSGMYNLQTSSSTLWGQNVLTIVTSVGDAITIAGAAFKRQPTVVYATVGGINQWVLEAGSVDMVLASGL